MSNPASFRKRCRLGPGPRKTSWSSVLFGSPASPFVLTRGGRENLNPVVICILKHLNTVSPPAWHSALFSQFLGPAPSKPAILYPPLAYIHGSLVGISTLCPFPHSSWKGKGKEEVLFDDPPMLAFRDRCISQGGRLPSQESNLLARSNTGPSCFPTISLTGRSG